MNACLSVRVCLCGPHECECVCVFFGSLVQPHASLCVYVFWFVYTHLASCAGVCVRVFFGLRLGWPHLCVCLCVCVVLTGSASCVCLHAPACVCVFWVVFTGAASCVCCL